MNTFERETMNGDVLAVAPETEIFEGEKEFVLKAEMPGLTRENIQIEFKADELTVSGKADAAEVAEGFRLVYGERAPKHYRQNFFFETEVDSDRIKASYENGVLTVTVPKAEKALPKKISIQ